MTDATSTELVGRMKTWMRAVLAGGVCPGCVAQEANAGPEEVEVCSMWGGFVELCGQALLQYRTVSACEPFFGVDNVQPDEGQTVFVRAAQFVACCGNGQGDTAVDIWQTVDQDEYVDFLHAVAGSFAPMVSQLHQLGALNTLLDCGPGRG